MLTVLALIATVALALEICLEPHPLCLIKLACDLWLAIPIVDTVGHGAQMQVDVAVLNFAQAAAVKPTQRAAAQLCCRGDVEEVLTQLSLEVNIQVGAGGLERKGQISTAGLKYVFALLLSVQLNVKLKKPKLKPLRRDQRGKGSLGGHPEFESPLAVQHKEQ